MKAEGEVDFIGCPALDPGPTVSLPAAGEGQMNATRLSLCRTDAHEPAVIGSSTGNRDANKERHQGRQKDARICAPALLSHIEYVSRKSSGRAGSSS
jgi:hypothetical protein